jgi:hypothetical protein
MAVMVPRPPLDALRGGVHYSRRPWLKPRNYHAPYFVSCPSILTCEAPGGQNRFQSLCLMHQLPRIYT